MSDKSSTYGFGELVEIMTRLRDPKKGCPWDLKQDFHTLVPYTLEEAYEVADAVERDDVLSLQAELGDLLLQVVFYARIAQEAGFFDIADVCSGITDKLRRRHPHVFGEESLVVAEDVSRRWSEIKQTEREQQQADASRMHDIPHVLPALLRAFKVQHRAAGVGFDWPDTAGVWDKLAEEQQELREAVDSSDMQHIEEEMGDFLFSCVNLSRHVGVDAENALRRAVTKFESRFRTMELLWQQAKVMNR